MTQLELPLHPLVPSSGDPVRTRNDPRGPYKRMVSGRKFYLADPLPEDFHIPDIVHHISRLPRFDGATSYSVGQHCVVAAVMARRFYPEAPLLPARMLIHDWVEAYYGDVSSPLKRLLPEYKRLETAAERQLEKRLGLTFIDDPLVKEVDDRMWLTERLLVMPGLTKEDDYDGPLEEFPIEEDDLLWYFSPWPAEAVEDELWERIRMEGLWQR